MLIEYYGYKYAPEQLKIYINNKKYEPLNNTIKYNLLYHPDKGIQDLKREYRQSQHKQKYITFCFFAENSNNYYYSKQLAANNNNLMDKLRIYKELKHHLQANPIKYITESGNITPNQAEAPTKTETYIKIDFNRCKKIYFI